jgi:hypothetical protein
MINLSLSENYLEVNFKARKGIYTKEDLELWTETQNKNIVSIQWYVKEYSAPISGAYDAYMIIPILCYREVKDD